MKLPDFDKLMPRSWFRIVVIALPIALLLSILTSLNLFRGNESLATDARFRTRDRIASLRIDTSIATIDWDEQSIELLGRWPWSWDRHASLVRFLNLYGARQIGFPDDHFSARTAITVPPDQAGIIEQQLMSDSTGQSLDFEHDLASAVNERKNVIFAADLFIPDEERALSPENEQERLIFADENRPPGRAAAITSAERFAGMLESRGDVLTAVEMKPPLKPLSEAAAGLGFNRVIFDPDGIVRRTPAMITFKGKPYPSHAVAMAAHRYGIPQDQIRYHAGKHIELGNLRIPIDERGFMIVNWTGKYHQTLEHIPFLFLAQRMAFEEGRKSIQGIDISAPGGAAAFFEKSMATMATSRLVTQTEAQILGTNLADAAAAEHYLRIGGTFDDFLAEYMGGQDPSGVGLEVWNAVLLNNRTAEKIAAGDTPTYDAMLAELKLQPSEVLKENFDHVLYFSSIGRIDQSHPLLFLAPVNLELPDSTIRVLSPLALRDRSIFIGLTATALNALNPTPFEERYQMHGLQPNAFNTIVTGQFVTEQPFWSQYIYIFAYSFLTVFLVLRFATIGQAASALGLAALHTGTAWISFAQKGMLIPIVTPDVAIGASYVGAVLFRYFEERRERRKVRGLFSAMVSPQVLTIMEERPDLLRLSGEKKNASMFSSDVSGFTTISEGVTAQELADILNIYLTPMSNIIMKYDGYVDKYEGDAIKAAFGVPLPDDDHPWKSACSALEQQEELTVIARMLLLKYGVKITARMGVNTGIVSVGNMGSEKKMQYTVMGEEVTLAEELEPANKLYESWIALGPETEERSRGIVETRHLDTMIMGPSHRPIRIYEALGWNRERYIDYWKERPLSPLFIEGWSRMTPEKALGYHYYYEIARVAESPMKKEIVELFSGLVPVAEEAIHHGDVIGLLVHRAALDELRELLAARGITATTAPRNEAEEWKRVLLEWKDDLRQYLLAVEDLPPSPEKDDLIKRVDSLEKRTESFLKRCSFPKETDTVARKLAEHLKSCITNTTADFLAQDRGALVRKQAEFQSKITVAMRRFLDSLGTAERRRAYHEFMADHCTASREKLEIRGIFNEARRHYVKQEWDAAEVLLRKALAIDPADGPSQKYIERIAHLRKEPPPADWNGYWSEE